ncbi:MAG: hypothetical protein IPO36_10985 [Anaerolineales bacterium]|uniref:hypothetical protein n=1 Tax=Candidatus Villigracilis affinis TaxID=3140682 RepID=UPI002A20FAA6|nr:hypothetical protein [Anaerolineales bacterium]MBL0345588.1 hypothetical protein [Anaerolineales bacterium]
MEVSRIENLPTPPGIINSIKAGFDMIASHITAILLPLMLNLFLWLGPRLRMNALFDSIKSEVIAIWKAGGVPAEDIQRILSWYETTIPSINLFWLLRTLPIGISSLLFPQQTASTPLGSPLILQVSAVSLVGWIFILNLLGWIGGGLYFRSVAWLAIQDKNNPPIRISRVIVQTVLTSIFWSILSVMILVPVFLVLAVVLQFSPFIANLLVLFLSLVSMWVVVPLFFWPHGIFLRRQNFATAIFSSVQMTRFTLPTSSMFVLTIFLLSVGLNFLWSIPPQDSWMTLVGIFGHSFVTTALLAASFVYYRDMNTWLQAVIEKLRPTAVTKA